MQAEKVLHRCEQDSNLRGNIPLDFESNALTTRPSQQQWLEINTTETTALITPKRGRGVENKIVVLKKCIDQGSCELFSIK